MKNILLAKRYAKALFDLAIEDKVLDAVKADMELVTVVMSENRELRKLMTNPVVPPARKKLVMRRIFEQHLSTLSLAFMDILIRKGREMEIQLIARYFGEFYLDYRHIAVVTLTTATPVDAGLQEKITGIMHQRTGKEIQIDAHIDESLIGGFVLKLDDYQYNASISKVIKRLHSDFDKNLFIKGF
ncbi:MAG: ATP synthase F1 subunit delta [Bacteroidetes bacterium]|nr:ATP synthase F1 subunit delta [Bacteroidota bacterium]